MTTRIARRSQACLVVVGLLLSALALVGCQALSAQLADGVAGADKVPESGVQVASAGELASDADGVDPSGFTAQGEPYRGNPDAAVVVEEFSSFQCLYCSKYFRETYPRLLDNYVRTGQVLYVFRDFPLRSQPQSPLAAQAANCAGQVGGAGTFWEMHDRLLERQSEWSGQRKAADILRSYAAELGLDRLLFNECLDSEETLAAVEADKGEGASRGVRSAPTFFISGRVIVGAQPYAAFARVLDAALVAEPSPGAPPAKSGALPTPATILPSDDALAMGSPEAPVTIVEYSDYQCPYCQRHFLETWPLLKAEFVDTGRLRYVFKDFPLTNTHPQALRTHEAARCAAELGDYWEMHDRIFEGQSDWADKSGYVSVLKGYASELGLDAATFDSCLESGLQSEAVQRDLAEGAALGVRSTPTFFIDGYPLIGAQPYEVFRNVIELAEQGRLHEVLQPVP